MFAAVLETIFWIVAEVLPFTFIFAFVLGVAGYQVAGPWGTGVGALTGAGIGWMIDRGRQPRSTSAISQPLSTHAFLLAIAALIAVIGTIAILTR